MKALEPDSLHFNNDLALYPSYVMVDKFYVIHSCVLFVKIKLDYPYIGAQKGAQCVRNIQ